MLGKTSKNAASMSTRCACLNVSMISATVKLRMSVTMTNTVIANFSRKTSLRLDINFLILVTVFTDIDGFSLLADAKSEFLIAF